MSLRTNPDTSNAIWSAADRGDIERVRELLADPERDINGRNCLGCTPLLYACGSGHLETVRLLLSHPDIDVNRRNNDRLTSFMLAMQGGALVGRINAGTLAPNSSRNHTDNEVDVDDENDDDESAGARRPTNNAQRENAQEKMKRLIDLPATDDLDWTRHDRWTALMEACNFGHTNIVTELLQVPSIDIDAVNLRGQTAEEVAISRGHDHLANMIRDARMTRENPEELSKIQELEREVETLKSETRSRLVRDLDQKYVELREIKANHEEEIEPLSQQIDILQTELEEAMKQRLAMITRQVRDIKRKEDEIRIIRRKLENFDRYARRDGFEHDVKDSSSSSSRHQDDLSLEKEFECSVCMDEMVPPVKIFQCINGHVMCEACKDHPEVVRCPCCRLALKRNNCEINLLRNIPMEKLASSYFNSRHHRQQHRHRHHHHSPSRCSEGRMSKSATSSPSLSRSRTRQHARRSSDHSLGRQEFRLASMENWL